MSTRATIAFTSRFHLYRDLYDGQVYLDFDTVQPIMSEQEWDLVEDQIFAKRLQLIQLGLGRFPDQIWDDPNNLNKEKLIENFKHELGKVSQ